MDSTPSTLAELLRPYNQTRIAEHLGVTRGAVSAWSTGETVPASDKIAALAEFLRIDIGKLSTLIAEAASKRRAEISVSRGS
jgi:transcriptional regulator with XRE-family HTH domain